VKGKVRSHSVPASGDLRALLSFSHCLPAVTRILRSVYGVRSDLRLTILYKPPKCRVHPWSQIQALLALLLIRGPLTVLSQSPDVQMGRACLHMYTIISPRA
jgi:hypothetical protein